MNIQIPLSLKNHVRQIWYMDESTTTEVAGTVDQGNEYPIFADGCPGIVFQQSDAGMYRGTDHKKLSSLFLYGQTVDPITLCTADQCRMIVVVFYPHVLKQLFRFDAKEITEDCLDLKLIPSVPRINLNEQLWGILTIEEQVQRIFEYVHHLIYKNTDDFDKAIQYAAAKIMKLNRAVSLKHLQVELNMSERTFERRFEQHVGISPKLLSSIAQFQCGLHQLKSNKFGKLSDIAYDNGYSDQSHFIRVFKKFTGISPLKFHKQLYDPFGVIQSPYELD